MHLRAAGECHGGCRAGEGYRPVAANGPKATSQAAAVARTSQSVDLTVQTAEGDRVVISLDAQSRLAASSRHPAQGYEFTGQSAYRQRVEVSVEGSLSEAELADITEWIDTLAAATRQAGQGGGLDAGALAAEFASLDSLAGFEYRYSESVNPGALFRLNA
jgi:hypothetical protein